MIQTFDGLGAAGLEKDKAAHDTSVPGWSDAKNMRFRDGYAEKFKGQAAVYDPPSIMPYYLLPYTSSSGRYWIYAGAGKAYCVTNTTHTDITKAATTYTGSLNGWTGGVLTGIAIINNGVEAPQFWAGNPATRFTDLTNWPASTTCKSIRPFRNFLVAMNVTKTGTNYPTMVKWSHEADPGAVPVSWDQTNPVYDAGEIDLADDQSKLIDGLQLGDQFICYKETAIYALQYIGAPYIFRVQKLTDAAGLLCANAVCGFPGGHVFVSQGDVMMLPQGGLPQSILTTRMKRYFIKNLDATTYLQTFCCHNPTQNEVWICYPKTGATYCTEAIVWNYLDNTLGLRELPNVIGGACGVVDYVIANSWNSDAETWNSDATAWNELEFTQSAQKLLLASSATKIYMADYGTTFAGTTYSAWLEKSGIDLGDATKVKTITSIAPRIDAPAGTVITVRFGGAMDLASGITWTAPISYTVGTDYRAYGFATGRYLAVRFENAAVGQWRLKSFDMDFTVTSKF